MEAPVIPFDLHRMFLGEDPPLFYLEMLVRTALIYLWTLANVRWIGGRGIAQLSLVEIVLVIGLGSAVGDAMFYPEVPLLLCMGVVTLVVMINKGLDKAIVRWQRAKVLVDGRPAQIVHEGQLVMAGLSSRNVGPDEVKAMLRQAGISNLGQVEHAYLEVNGQASVFRLDRPRPGLRIVPPTDVVPPEALSVAEGAPRGLACCVTCGRVSPAASVLPDAACANCARRDWVAPDIPPEAETAAPT